jgi:hypothetical protein
MSTPEREPTQIAPAPRVAFDPARYLSKVNGADYLECKWRLVWLRDRDPDARIETEAVTLDPAFSLFKATITLSTGGSATGYGSETPQDFRDHIEKAETKAIGRALAALGFGTQFCPDHDFGAAQGRVVDAPVCGPHSESSPRSEPRSQPPRPAPATGPDQGATASGPDQQATDRQLRYLQAVARERLGLDAEALDQRSMREYGVTAGSLSRRDASALIEAIQFEASQTRQ